MKVKDNHQIRIKSNYLYYYQIINFSLFVLWRIFLHFQQVFRCSALLALWFIIWLRWVFPVPKLFSIHLAFILYMHLLFKPTISTIPTSSTHTFLLIFAYLMNLGQPYCRILLLSTSFMTIIILSILTLFIILAWDFDRIRINLCSVDVRWSNLWLNSLF